MRLVRTNSKTILAFRQFEAGDHMTSQQQLQANKINARNSTGPRTPEGKAKSRLNSRKHGLTGRMLIIVGEVAEDFDRLRVELLEEHNPQSSLEIELVERIAGILWRLRRVPSFEAAILDARHVAVEHRYSEYRALNEKGEDAEDDEEEQELADWDASVKRGRTLIEDATTNDALGKLARHETTLMNALTKTLQLLLVLQERRGREITADAGVGRVALPESRA